MEHDPTTPGGRLAGHHPIDLVAEAERQLRCFGGTIDQTTADRLLSFWHRYDQLSGPQIEQVCARFPAVTS